MIDLSAVRDAYNEHEISNIGFLKSQNNPADGLTKTKHGNALDHLLKTGKADFFIYQWAIRKMGKNSSITNFN